MSDITPYIVRNARYRKTVKNKIIGKSIELVNTDTGELMCGNLVVENTKYTDTTLFIKCYDVSIFVKLGKSGLHVLTYCLEKLDYNGVISFGVESCRARCGFNTRKSVYEGLSQLKALDVIRKKDDGEYWINPNIFWKGNRSKLG